MAPTYGGQSYYQVLGIGPHATPREIKRSYRRRVRMTHPDLNRHAEADAEFRLVKRAYEVLSDAVERDRYDMLMGLGKHAHYARFYRRSFDRLFDCLFNSLRRTLDATPVFSKAIDEARRKVG